MLERRSTPTWQYVAVTTIGALGATIVLLVTIAGYAYTDTQKRIKELSEGKADKEDVVEMKADMKDIKNMLTSHIIATGSGRVAKRSEEP